MNTRECVVKRLVELVEQAGITPNGLAYRSGVAQSTIKSILGGESKNPGIVTLKKLCDGLEISLPHFFDTKEFKELEQEIQ